MQLQKQKLRTEARWSRYGNLSLHYRYKSERDKHPDHYAVINVNNHYHGEKKDRGVDKNWMNSYQYFLFRRCLYGLEVYDKTELGFMSEEKKQRIANVHEHAIFVLGMLKQRALVAITSRLLRKMFPRGRFLLSRTTGKNVLTASPEDRDPEFKVKLSYEELGITRKMMVCELVERRCLPWKFFELTVNDDPRMIKLKQSEGPIDQL